METPTFILFIFLSSVVITHSQPIGTWQILSNSVGIASMHSAVTRFNTVVMLDRTNIGPSRINLPNGRCRRNAQDQMSTNDCSAHSVMFNIATNGVRPLFIFTDTWCSSGAFLGDGTLLQTGGGNDGVRKIRRIAPCAAGGNCDWVETNINLAQDRWYATDQLLPDGRVIVVGGRGVFSYEFVPKTGNQGSIALPFLQQTTSTQADNLYPFVHLMPNGNLFIFANRDSIELNYRTNRVVRNYPRIPGEPRNYPSAGSSVLLPLDGPTNYAVSEVMVCGGSRANAFSNPAAQFTASQTCGRMVISSANPGWAMSNMPTPRNMGDMVLLPSGEILIINGASKGCQGFGLASDPVLTPVLYEPASRRFLVQRASPIPRMYHSTANLLPDARVLVAGSNTHVLYRFTGAFPTELRVEAFSPPYLHRIRNSQRPQITNVPATIRYGQAFTVTFTIGNILNKLEMNILSAPFTTHSFSQGQRMLRLTVAKPVRVSGNTYTVAVTAPPNGNVAPSSYYMLFPLIQGIPGRAAWVRLL